VKYRNVILLLALILLATAGIWKLRATPEEETRIDSPLATADPMTQTTTDYPSPGSMKDAASTHLPAKVELQLRKDFDRFINGVRTSLPKIADVKRSARGSHETPSDALASGKKLGELAKFLGDHPDFIKAALPTYLDCALNGTVLPATRALCTFRIKSYEKYASADLRAAYREIPDSIRALAAELEGTE
jgi:hypothetical protein